MSDELRIDPEALHRAGNAIAGHGELLSTLHQHCRDQAREAHAGWVGSSAEALSELLDSWTTASAAHLSHIEHHSSGMKSAAAVFVCAEERGAGALAHPAVVETAAGVRPGDANRA